MGRNRSLMSVLLGEYFLNAFEYLSNRSKIPVGIQKLIQQGNNGFIRYDYSLFSSIFV